MPTDSGVATLDNPEHLRTHSYNFFVNDTWRVRPDLTLLLGLRYEFNSPPVDAQNHANLYDQATQTLVPVGTDGMPRSGYVPNRDNFAPRVGLAWTPAGSRTVVRAGYGVYYDQSSLAPGEGLYFSPPYFNLNVYYPVSATQPLLLSNPFPGNFRCPLRPQPWRSNATCTRLMCSNGISISSTRWAAAVCLKSAMLDRRARI